ncbi:MAG: hypothetical protein IDH49_02345 [Gammaproteobacteria bacterium]|nr:hypothetical protein [Gammaproteobacteria bacterium]
MPTSITELAAAKGAAAALLDELGLEAYLFEVEPREGQWELRVECAVEAGWESVMLPVDKPKLLASREDAAVHAELLAAWRERLAACKKR